MAGGAENDGNENAGHETIAQRRRTFEAAEQTLFSDHVYRTSQNVSHQALAATS